MRIGRPYRAGSTVALLIQLDIGSGALGSPRRHSRYLRPFAFFALSLACFRRGRAMTSPGAGEALMLAPMGLDPAIGYPHQIANDAILVSNHPMGMDPVMRG
jgi:hypothetical protein